MLCQLSNVVNAHAREQTVSTTDTAPQPQATNRNVRMQRGSQFNLRVEVRIHTARTMPRSGRKTRLLRPYPEAPRSVEPTRHLPEAVKMRLRPNIRNNVNATIFHPAYSTLSQSLSPFVRYCGGRSGCAKICASVPNPLGTGLLAHPPRRVFRLHICSRRFSACGQGSEYDHEVNGLLPGRLS